MATLIPVPKLGQSEETVTIESWKVKEGDQIKKGDVLFEVETDKTVLEVESQFEGTLLKIVVPAGKPVPVMSIAAVLGAPGEAIPDIKPVAAAAPAAAASAPKAAASAAAPKAAAAAPVAASAAPVAMPSPVAAPRAAAWKPHPTPRAKAFAKELLINLDKVVGTGGESGRVTEKDIKDYLERTGYNNIKITPSAFNLAQKEKLELLDLVGTGDLGRVTLADVRSAASEKVREFNAMRRIIAQRLLESKQTIPHFYVTVSVDMTDLMAYRKTLKNRDLNFSVNVFVVKAVAMALKEFPMCNSWTNGVSYRYKSNINVGVAVSVPNGLVVPVIRNTDRKALDEIQAESADMATKARDGKLSPDEMKGGTFTISNMGMMGVENFAAIINPGEAAILAVSASVPAAAVKDGQIAIRDMMKMTLSADHRVVDGSDAARFVQAVKLKLEDKNLWETWI